MTFANLDNLVKINKLKVEPPDQYEFDGMVSAAKNSLQDSQVEGLSEGSQFSLAYSAPHALALAWIPIRLALFSLSMFRTYCWIG